MSDKEDSNESSSGEEEKEEQENGKRRGDEEEDSDDDDSDDDESEGGGAAASKKKKPQEEKGKAKEGGSDEDDDEDSDSDDEDSDAEPSRRKAKVPRPKKLKKKRKRSGFLRSSMIDDEAAESGEEDERGSGDEEEEDDENEYVHDDFVVPDEVAMDEVDRESLDSDEEQNQRREKKRRRIKRTDVEEMKDELEQLRDDGEQYDEEEDLKARRRRPQRDEEEYDSDDSWLVKDYEDEEEGGQRRERRRQRAIITNVDQDQLEDLLAVFPEEDEDGGDMQQEGEGRRRRGGLEEEEEDEEDEGEEGFRWRDKGLRPTVARPQAHLEPALMKEHFMTMADDKIRKEDLPERTAIRSIRRHHREQPMDDIERNDEATWIVDQLRLEVGGNRPAQIDSVIKVLELMDIDKYEVPFIWTYRRDYLGDFLDRDKLWRIAQLDEKWEELQRRKESAAKRMDRLTFANRGEDERRTEDLLREAEQQLREAERGVELWRKKVTDLQEKEEKKLLDDDSEDEFEDEPETLPQAKSSLQDSERRHAEALSKVQKLEQDHAAAMARQEVLGLAGGRGGDHTEELLNDLCPDTYRTLLENAQDDEVIRDVQDYLGLIGQDSTRRAQRLAFDFYRRCRSVKELRAFANLFTIPAPLFGVSIAGSIMGGDKPDVPTPLEQGPESLAADYVSGAFTKYEDVLRAVKHMLAMEVAHEPKLRALLRKAYRTEATLSTNPTIKGKNEMDEFHRFHGLQYLKRKPLYDFLGAGSTLFLRILQAEREGFLSYTIDPPGEASDDNYGRAFTSEWSGLLNYMDSYYNPAIAPDQEDTNAYAIYTSWVQERRDVLTDAIKLYVLPMLEAEVRRLMKMKAEEDVLKESAQALKEVVSYGPYVPKYRNVNSTYLPPLEDFSLRFGGRRLPIELAPLHGGIDVMSIILTPSRSEPSFAVSVGRDGTVRDFVMLPHIRGGINGDAEQREKLQKIMIDARPHVVVVNAMQGYEAVRMKERLTRVIERVSAMYREGDLAADEEGWEACEVLIVEETLARVYARSTRVKKEFVDYHENLRTAVALARQLQDPLALVTLIYSAQDPRGGKYAGPGYQLLFLHLNELQDEVNPHEISRRYEEVIVDAVNDVGVDLNKAITSLHLASMLPFVCGMGFRKANALRAAVRARSGVVISRAQLLDDGFLTPKVYENAAGFLRIRATRGEEYEDDFDDHHSSKASRRRKKREVNLLDNTRIHPECYNTYEWASKICRDSIEHTDSTTTTNELVTLVMQDCLNQLLNTLCPAGNRVIDYVWDPERNEPQDDLSKLDLEQYANYLEQTGCGKRHLQLHQIKTELRFPYRDRRPPFHGHNEDKIFELLSGETDATLRPGLPVTGRVTSVNETSARVKLDQLIISGYLHRSRYPGMQRDMDFVALVPIDTPIEGVVTEVEKPKMSVRISCLEDDTHRIWERPYSLPPLDAYFDVQRALDDYRERRVAMKEGIRMAKEEKRKASIRRRKVDYEKWKACNHLEAEKYLRDLGKVGEWVFRPSGQPGSLTLSWLVLDDVVVHIPIKEEDKAPGDDLGKKLTIAGKTYQELDQVVAQYITPMNDLIESVISHRKFKKMTKQQVENELRACKRANPRQVYYFFYPDEKRLGSFKLGHAIRTKLMGEIVEVTPKGLRFRGQNFRSGEEVADYFKDHYKEDPTEMMSSAAAAAAAKTSSSSGRPSSQGGGERGDRRRDGDHRDGIGGGATTSAAAIPSSRPPQQVSLPPPPPPGLPPGRGGGEWSAVPPPAAASSATTTNRAPPPPPPLHQHPNHQHLYPPPSPYGAYGVPPGPPPGLPPYHYQQQQQQPYAAYPYPPQKAPPPPPPSLPPTAASSSAEGRRGSSGYERDRGDRRDEKRRGSRWA